ncbi:hypothetical protein MtrunA17_Chr4g0072581 [Medicago truncatula]|uniref:Uncharacterized protein n=1 Tax=Medicago truncatula TaxID=3880 RepID=A0A396IIR1_MEDTR|nr:hypothetical protein MtrunA17_Chr4g0072581 [Medicago truncatula]
MDQPSDFSYAEKLVAGDLVVFMKNARGAMFNEIRRVVRFVPQQRRSAGAGVHIRRSKNHRKQRNLFSVINFNHWNP